MTERKPWILLFFLLPSLRPYLTAQQYPYRDRNSRRVSRVTRHTAEPVPFSETNSKTSHSSTSLPLFPLPSSPFNSLQTFQPRKRQPVNQAAMQCSFWRGVVDEVTGDYCDYDYDCCCLLSLVFDAHSFQVTRAIIFFRPCDETMAHFRTHPKHPNIQRENSNN